MRSDYPLALCTLRGHKTLMSNRLRPLARIVVSLSVLLAAAAGFAAANPYLGSWALTIPEGAAGWLGVEEAGGALKASMLWGGGSVEPTASARVDGDHLVVTRNHTVDAKDAGGKRIRKNVVETITATVQGDRITLVSSQPKADGSGEETKRFSGSRTPPPGPAPDLAKVKFSPPVPLFNGKDLAGWRLTDPNATSGWKAQAGLLVNEVNQEQGKPHKSYGNLRTDRDFTDFNLTLETRLAKGGNSGVYIRGIYEVQVADTYGRPLDPHNMGAVYSRITPSVAAEKPPGEWQTMDITFVQRHVTVILNGTKIIDNQPILGCTGGALWSDVSKPGPIYLQGDHTGIEYRNLVIRPVAE